MTERYKSLLIFIFLSITCAFLIALLYQVTAPQIQENQQQALKDQLNHLVKNIAYNNAPLQQPLFIQSKAYLGSDEKMPLYILKQDNHPVAFVFNAVAPDGYNGAIFLVVALDPTGRVLGVRIVKHHETPGLGDYFEQNKQWLDQYIDKNQASVWDVKKDGGEFDAWSGATITPRAITQAVGRVAAYFQLHRDKWT